MIAAAFTIHNQGGSTWESAKTLFENLKKHDLYERFARVFESSDITEDDKIKGNYLPYRKLFILAPCLI
jgi:hypothetical protein